MQGTERYLSRDLFTADFAHPETVARKSYTLTTARQVGFKEKWLQEAVISNPQIVLAPCREAGLLREAELWSFWEKEVTVPDVGSIDVLLISSSGRIGVVETKLAYNPDARRKVVAQILEYAINLNSISKLPAIPAELTPYIDEQDVREGMQKGDYLLIIAGDRLDSRAVKLSQAVLAAHLVRPWVLALVEVAIFEEESDSGSKTHLLVPHIRGTILPERRQVVTIEIQGDRTRVDIGPATPVATGWDEERFFAKAEGVEQTLRQFAEELRQLREEHSDVSLVFGHGKAASVTLHKGRDGILTFQIDGSGSLSFNRPAFPRALGQEQGSYYRRKLETLFPGMNKEFSYIKLQPKTAATDLRTMIALLREVLTNAPFQAHSEVVASS